MSYWQGSNFSTESGEKWDGRMFFHQRRHFIHLEIMKWSQLAMTEPKHLGDWCASLQALHRLLWGSLEDAKIKIGEYELSLNDYLEKKLLKINDKFMNSITYFERGDGELHIRIAKDKLQGLYKALDRTQKQLAVIEYKKNLDLPKRANPIIKATRGGL